MVDAAAADAALRDQPNLAEAGRYRETIEKCRDVRNTVEKALEARDADGARVADQLGSRTSASQRMVAFIDDVWKGLAEPTNEAHHPTERSKFTAAGARACLLTTAVMVEAISELLAPAEL